MIFYFCTAIFIHSSLIFSMHFFLPYFSPIYFTSFQFDLFHSFPADLSTPLLLLLNSDYSADAPLCLLLFKILAQIGSAIISLISSAISLDPLHLIFFLKYITIIFNLASSSLYYNIEVINNLIIDFIFIGATRT